MKQTKLFILFIGMLICAPNANAQLWKRLKNKVDQKVEELERKAEDKIDKKIDETLDGKKKKTTTEEKTNKSKESKIRPSGYTGSAVLNHSQKYGTYRIEKFGKATAHRENEELRIFGSWVSHGADIADGYVLVIPEGNTLLFDDKQPLNKTVVLNIPEDAQLTLSYDPVWDANQKSENGFVRAVTKNYQSYDLKDGTVTIKMLNESQLQFSFEGTHDLEMRTKLAQPTNDSEYAIQLVPSSISGSIEVKPVLIRDNRTLKKRTTEKRTQSVDSNSRSISNSSTSRSSTTGIYEFTHSVKTRITTGRGDEAIMYYYLKPNTTYAGMKVALEDYGSEGMGETMIVMDNGESHVFVNAGGQKIKMSQSQMGEQSPTAVEKLEEYDYSGLKKTGRTKTILGETCHEYEMSDNNNSFVMWVAHGLDLPNWFMQDPNMLSGHILEYTVTSRGETSTMTTIEIDSNAQTVIDPSEYKKMF